MKTKWLISLRGKNGTLYTVIGLLTYEEAGQIESRLESQTARSDWPYAHIELLAEVTTVGARAVNQLISEGGR